MTITTAAASGFAVGEQVVIGGVGVAAYNGTFTITSVPSATTFTYTLSASGLAASSGGTAIPANAITTLVEGQNYFFNYDSTDHIIYLIPAAGVWPEGYTYNISLSTAIKDRAGNPLQPNRLDQTNQFTIVLAGANATGPVPAAGIEFSQAPDEPVAWQVEPTNPTLYLGTLPPQTTPAYVPLATRSYNDGAISTSGFTLTQGMSVTVPVTVTNAGTTMAYLGAWVDFNADDTFADLGDQVVTDQPVAPDAAISSATESGTTVTITTAAAHNFAAGDVVVISGVGVSGYDGTFTIASATATTFTYTVSATKLAASSGGTAALSQVPITFTVPTGLGNSVAISAPRESGSAVTITTATAHHFTVGEQVVIAGVGVAGYNGMFTIVSVPTANTFTYTDSTTGLAASSGGGTSLVVGTWLRLRLSSQQGLTSVDGMPVTDYTPSPDVAVAEPDGEVEDFPIAIQPGVTVTGNVYDDLAADGILTLADEGMPLQGITIDAYDANGNILASTTTNVNGAYTLIVPPNEAVTIGEVLQGSYANYVQTYPLTAAPTNGVYTVDGVSGATVSGDYFLDYPTMTISGYVYFDLNGNGTYNASDPGLPNWTVYVNVGGSGYQATDPQAVTNASGFYQITNAPANLTDLVGEEPQANWVETSPGPASTTFSNFLTVTSADPSNNDFYDAYNGSPSLASPATSAITVVGVNLVPGSPSYYLTKAPSVQYVVTFNEPVTGLATQSGKLFTEFNFTGTASSLSGETVSSVVPTVGVDSFPYNGLTYTTSYTVTVSGISGNGILQLNLADLGVIKDSQGRTLVGAGAEGGSPYPDPAPAVTIQQTPPSLSAPNGSIVLTKPTVATNYATNGATATYVLTFSEAVTGVAVTDLALATTTSVGASLANSTFSVAPTTGASTLTYNGATYCASYTVTVALGGAVGSDGAVQLVVDTGAPIYDLAGNELVTTPQIKGQAITVDRVQPKPTITVPTSQPNPATSGPVNFTVVFSAAVTGFTSGSQVSLAGSTVSGTLVATVTGSGTTYNISVSGMTGSGVVDVSIPANVAEDNLGNWNVASNTASLTVTTTPTVVVTVPSTQQNPVNHGPLVFTVTFNQAVTGFTASSLSFTGSTAPGISSAVGKYTATVSAGTMVGTNQVYTVSVTGMTATGLVMLSVPAGAVHNASGTVNAASTGTSNNVFYDIDPATEALYNPTAGSSLTTAAINAQGYINVLYSCQTGVGLNTSTITDAGEEFTLSGAAAAGVTVNGAAVSLGNDVFQYHFTGSFTAGVVTVNFTAGSFQDNAGNYNKASSFSFTTTQATPGLSINNVSVVKPTSGKTTAVFTVSLSSAAKSTVTVKYTTVAGTNTTAGKDFTTTSGTLTFTAGQTVKSITVPVLGNTTAVKSPETFTVVLSSPSSGATLVSGHSTGTCTITAPAASPVKAALVVAIPSAPAASVVNSAMVAAIAQASQPSSATNNKTAAVDAVLATFYAKAED